MHRRKSTTEVDGQSPTPKVYSIPEAARILGIGEASLYALLRSGQLRRTKVLGRTLITTVEIDRFLAEATEGLEPPVERIPEGNGAAMPQGLGLRSKANTAGRPTDDTEPPKAVARKPIDLAAALAAGPVEPVLRSWLIRLLDEFYDATGLAMPAICTKVCGADANLYDGLKGGHKTFSAYTFDRSVAGLSNNWPEDLPWPAGIPRFGEGEVRPKPRRS